MVFSNQSHFKGYSHSILILELKALIPHNVHFSEADIYLVVLDNITLKLRQRFMADLNCKSSELTIPQVVYSC